MERLSVIQARLRSVGQLAEVVGAMRTLAAARMQQAAEALPAARRYAEIIAHALTDVVASVADAPPSSPGRAPAVLLFCAEHGFVGGYTTDLLQAVRARSPRRLFIVGNRGGVAAEELGLRVDWRTAMTSHAGGVAEVARRVAAELYRRFLRNEFTALDCVFGRLDAGGAWSIDRETLLPLDLARFHPVTARVPPLHHLRLDDLATRLIAEYFLADLVRAALESLGAENAARLRAMSAAHDNIQKKLEDLHGQERAMRQEQITEELLDIVAGAELLLRQE